MDFRKIFWLVIMFSFLISSCKDDDIVTPLTPDIQEENLQTQHNNDGTLTVMTRNIYVGADVDKILQAEDPNEVPLLVTEVFQSLLSTNFPERAQALAEEILTTQPHLIGLQEVSLLRMQSPGDAAFEGTIPAEEVVMDYLDILLMTMNAMGLEYEVVAKIQNADVEMPMVVSHVPDFDDIRLTDYDVILAKKGIEISNVVERNFKASVSIPELGIEMPRGYVAVTAKVNGNKYRFVNTHLEDADQGGDLLKTQLAQAAELLLRLARVQIPVVLVGDFNSAAQSEPTYKLVTLTRRYKDTWLENSLSNNIEGLTYGHDPDLLNPSQDFWKRIDYIFVRNGRYRNYKIKLHKVTAEVLGDEVEDKTPSNLWPSDHGGIAAELIFKSTKDNKRKWIK